MSKNVKTWRYGEGDCVIRTEASPRERPWIAYLDPMAHTVHVARASLYYGVVSLVGSGRHPNVYTVSGERINDEMVVGEYQSRAEADERADEIARDGFLGQMYARS